ncbi:hypothetical protein WA026_016091 [Henosepilachna vigintioctopunctata]|uniref:SAM-dependent MTase RsmB/NOP-type domain-containing protein n=1 Tax=Henosepilachna vigintioctopunctata TaxID=420089 RepID=A0AAW1U7Y6_9CUCU
MPYPDSPFRQDIELCLINNMRDKSNYISKMNNYFRWLCTTPQITSLRVNTLQSNPEDTINLLKKYFQSIKPNMIPNVSMHEKLEDVIIIQHVPSKLESIHLKEVIVDVACGAAVLRGAHIFAPGVLGMVNGCQTGDNVSIYVDLAKKCNKGFSKIYKEAKVFIGNGVVVMPRSSLFSPNLKPNGIAVQVSETISGCFQISENILPPGYILLQNLPSIICVHALDPKPNEIILDMCASPGHKTSHIAALMKNQGTLVAIDKITKKIELLKEHCANFNAKAHIFLSDSTSIFQPFSTNTPENGPPYPAGTFDKILLDAPCSALGRRPQFRNDITKAVLLSYVPLQKKLFSNAVHLLKKDGILVYSTCTISVGENENIVAWALKKFPDLTLIETKFHFGSGGLDGTSLSKEELRLVQRFGECSKTDSIGFFIACFTRK